MTERPNAIVVSGQRDEEMSSRCLPATSGARWLDPPSTHHREKRNKTNVARNLIIVLHCRTIFLRSSTLALSLTLQGF